jgi:hypothetical protein
MIRRTRTGNVMVQSPFDGARWLYDQTSADKLMREMGCDPETCDVNDCRDSISGEHLVYMLQEKVRPMRVWKVE